MNTDHHRQVADWIARRARSGSVVIGINGAQGSGKSTLARALQADLSVRHHLHTAVLSLDDLYLTHDQRKRMAAECHPLLATRGVPATHDVELGLRLIRSLKAVPAGASLLLPRFIKALDDRAPEADWTRVHGPVAVILFEGWCVGTPAQDLTALQPSVNQLEAEEDAQGGWRQLVNARLAGDYARLFAQLDALVYLKIPDFGCVYRWRLQQEAENASQPGEGQSRIMGPQALQRFIQHYERLTRHAMQVLPARADCVVELGQSHEIRSLSFQNPSGQAVP